MRPRPAHDGFVLGGTQGWLLTSVLLWILLDESIMFWRRLLVPLLLVIRLSRHGLLLNEPDLISCLLPFNAIS